MNHLGDTNKKVSETPRTDARRGFHGLDTAVDAEFSEQIELELNAANARIKRLIDAGDAMFPWSERVGQEFWTKAKEAKL